MFEKKPYWVKLFLNGVFYENPILILLIGLCPILACSSNATDALGMGLAASFVLVCSNVMVSIIRKTVPSGIRIPIFIVIIATFVTVADYSLQAYFPSLSESLGVFIPLIVVNCIILGRAEAFAYHNSVWNSLWDGLGMGAGFTFAIFLLGSTRELLGAGTILNSGVILSNPATLMILPPGAFIAFGVLISVWKKFILKTQNGNDNPCVQCNLAMMCHTPEEERCEALEKFDSENKK